MQDYISIRLPVGDIAGFGASPELAAWLFVPRSIDADQLQTVAFCVHGGSYDKRYFHIEAPALDGYSMCRYLAERGVVAVTIDWLGNGESSRAQSAQNIIRKTLSKAHHAASAWLLDHLRQGTLTPAIPPLRRVMFTGVGHSMGGKLVILQQAEYRSFDTVAVLGWSNLGSAFPPSLLASLHTQTDSYITTSADLRREFHLFDVPHAVLDSPAEREIAPIAGALLAEMGDLDSVRGAAGQIETPVFLSYSEKDVSPSPYEETACFKRSRDITFFHLAGSAHCHNFSNTRQVLWRRIAEWLESMQALRATPT